MNRNEAETRRKLIDPALINAGWDLENAAQVRFEIPVDGYDATPWNGITDYTLYNNAGEVLAIVEAKRTSRDPRVAEEQVRHYVSQISQHQRFQPFAFMSNGYETYFWDLSFGNKRQVAGFFTADELVDRLFMRENALPLESVTVNPNIVDRTYQLEAIARTIERFGNRHQRALLVMATGTGKTRTTMAIVDVLMRANQCRRVLFVADRDTLAKQALNDGFKAFLRDEPRTRLRSYEIDKTKRLFATTLQTLALCYQKISPGFFDLVIFDEAHRSLFNQYRDIVEYFDARMIGLTATP